MMRTLRVSKTWLMLAIIATFGLLSAPLSAFACCCAGMVPPTQDAAVAPVHQRAAATSAKEDMPCCKKQDALTVESAKAPSCHLATESRASHFQDSKQDNKTVAASSITFVQQARLSANHECGCQHDDNLAPAITENRLSVSCFIPVAGALPVRAIASVYPSFTTTFPTATPFSYRSHASLPFAGRAPPLN